MMGNFMKKGLHFRNLNLSQRLVLYNIVSSLIIILFTMLPIHTLGKSIISEGVEKQMELILEAKKNEIGSYFEYKVNDIKIIRNSYAATQGLRDMLKGFQEKSQQLGGSAKSRDYFRKIYIENNPNPTSSRLKLLEGDGSEYSKAHGRAMPYLSAILKERNYYDVIIIDANEGDVIYTVLKESDYMTNLLTGPYKDTNLAKLFRKVISVKEGAREVFFADYEPYAPSQGKVSAFVGTGIFLEGKLSGVLVFQLPLDEITEKVSKPILDNRAEKAFIVGSDFYLRTDPNRNSSNSNYVLKQKVQTASVREALTGKTGHLVIDQGVNGKRAFNAYSPLELLGNRLALIVELDYDETMKGLNQFQSRVSWIALIMLLVVLVSGIIFSKSISVPVRESVQLLSTSIREISSVMENHEKTAHMQSASVNQTTATLSHISGSSKDSAEESQIVTLKAKNAQELSSAGQNSVVEMMHSIDELKMKVSGIAEQILRLSEKNSQISSIISLVSELANETNMLALNAAVEAARAGENGKGFEVVAVEIRKLADESKKSALKIQEIISEIKSATDSTVMVTEEGVKQADESVKLGTRVLDSLSGINSSVNSVFGSIEKIALNIQQQSVSIEEIVFAMNSINKGSQETANGIAETKVGVDQIAKATKKLKDLVEGQS